MSFCILTRSSAFNIPVGSVWFTVTNTNPSTWFGGTWELIGSKLAVRENVFGNGYNLAVTDGTGRNGGLLLRGSGNDPTTNTACYGQKTGYWPESGGQLTYNKALGSPTKDGLGLHPEYSGLIVDTETIYSWKKTA